MLEAFLSEGQNSTGRTPGKGSATEELWVSYTWTGDVTDTEGQRNESSETAAKTKWPVWRWR